MLHIHEIAAAWVVGGFIMAISGKTGIHNFAGFCIIVMGSLAGIS